MLNYCSSEQRLSCKNELLCSLSTCFSAINSAASDCVESWPWIWIFWSFQQCWEYGKCTAWIWTFVWFESTLLEHRSPSFVAFFWQTYAFRYQYSTPPTIRHLWNCSFWTFWPIFTLSTHFITTKVEILNFQMEGGSGWTESLEKDFDKAFVSLDLLLGEIDSDQVSFLNFFIL